MVEKHYENEVDVHWSDGTNFEPTLIDLYLFYEQYCEISYKHKYC